MLSFIVPDKINGSCSTYATLPFLLIFPLVRVVSLRIAARRVDFPDPTSPMITNSSSSWILMSIPESTSLLPKSIKLQFKNT